jgi:hypothetical protein
MQHRGNFIILDGLLWRFVLLNFFKLIIIFKTRGRFSVISDFRASPFNEMTEKHPLVLQNIVNHLISIYLKQMFWS